MSPVKQKIIVLLGPTASGKSDLGVALARKFGGEIISADSRQVYRGLDIGSGKITKKETRNIPHFCLDIASPHKVFTAKDYEQCARKAIAIIRSKNKIPIIVGGTGFYIDAALGRMHLADAPPNFVLRKKLAKQSAAKLFVLLKKMDPNRAQTIDAKNPARLIRAIEVAKFRPKNLTFSSRLTHLLMGSDASQKMQSFSTSPRNILWLGIKRSPEELKKRIEKRLTQRLPGIIREIKKLRAQGISWKRLYELGLEYRYVSLFVRGKLAKIETIRQLETAIRHYAKRQMTWFRRNKNIQWISNIKQAKTLIKRFLNLQK